MVLLKLTHVDKEIFSEEVCFFLAHINRSKLELQSKQNCDGFLYANMTEKRLLIEKHFLNKIF